MSHYGSLPDSLPATILIEVRIMIRLFDLSNHREQERKKEDAQDPVGFAQGPQCLLNYILKG